MRLTSIGTVVFGATAVVALAVGGCTTSSAKKTSTLTHTVTATPTCGGDGNLCNVAGAAGMPGYGGDGGPAVNAWLYWPQDMWVDSSGLLYVLDWNNHRIRTVDQNGIINTIVGGAEGDSCGTTADGCNMNHPTDIKINPATGILTSATWHNHRIKTFTGSPLMVNCIAPSNPTAASCGFAGDGGPASAAKFCYPSSIVFDSNGNTYISDQGNQRIRVINSSGVINTFAGTGAAGFADGPSGTAQFWNPVGQNAYPAGKLAISNDNSFLYVADTLNNRVRQINISTGIVSTIAGSAANGYTGDGGPATAAQLNGPTDVAVGPDGSLYIADKQNNVIRKMTVGGNIWTVAGTGTAGSSPNGTPSKQAMLNSPSGVWVTSANTLYIADTLNDQVKIVRNPQ